MTKPRKLTRRSRTNRNQGNGKGSKANAVNGSAANDSSAAQEAQNKTNPEFDTLIERLEAGEFDSDTNLQLLYREYQKATEEDGDLSSEVSDEVEEENRKLTRLNEQLHHEITILKKELENMKQSQRDQAELDKLVDYYKIAMVEKETLLQELDQRLHFLSHQLQDVPVMAVPPDHSGYRTVRAQMLANTILPNFYKKRLSMELDFIEQVEADEADVKLLELNLMRELIHYHETELKQLLKN